LGQDTKQLSPLQLAPKSRIFLCANEAQMKKSLALALLFQFATCQAAAQSSAQPAPSSQPSAPANSLATRVPAPKAADVDSVNHILTAIYASISGPAGPRDWDRFRSLCAPEARFTSTVKSPDSSEIRLLSVDDFINLAGQYFSTHPFFETALVNRVQRFGNIGQTFSSYESRNAPNEKPFTRGINSIQTFYDGSRWWVVSILWDEESPTNPLPPNMAKRSSAAAPNKRRGTKFLCACAAFASKLSTVLITPGSPNCQGS
jgi:hypothetical protein